MTYSYWEGQTGRYTATLRDDDGVAVPADQLTAMTLTLIDADTGAIVNSRSAQNVLNANNVTISAQGLVTWSIQPADTTRVSTASAKRTHVAIFVFTYALGAKVGKHRTSYVVREVTNG